MNVICFLTKNNKIKNKNKNKTKINRKRSDVLSISQLHWNCMHLFYES